VRTPTSSDDAVLAAARASLAQFIADVASASRWLIESAHPGPPDAFLSNPQSFLPTLAELFRHEALPREEQQRWCFPVAAVISEYLCRDFRGVWIMEDDPTHERFAQPMVEVELEGGGLVHVDLLLRASEFLVRPAPRDLFADLVTPLQQRLSA
jgi:hypothetical protein